MKLLKNKTVLVGRHRMSLPTRSRTPQRSAETLRLATKFVDPERHPSLHELRHGAD